MTASLQVPLQITFRNMPRSDALDAHIRQKAAKLETFHTRRTSRHVTDEELAKRDPLPSSLRMQGPRIGA